MKYIANIIYAIQISYRYFLWTEKIFVSILLILQNVMDSNWWSLHKNNAFSCAHGYETLIKMGVKMVKILLGAKLNEPNSNSRFTVGL